MTARDSTFGASFGTIFTSGVRGYTKNIPALTLASAVTLGIYLVFRFPAQRAFERDELFVSLGFDLIGLILASTLAYPWYRYALDAADGVAIDLRRPWRHALRFVPQAVASIWFWAGVLLGLRYLLGLPSILVVIFYAFYGFVIADGGTESGLRALGTSVRIGDGKRIGLLALSALFLVFNFFGAIALGYGVNPLTVVLTIIGLSITTNITMVSGAYIYRLLEAGANTKAPKGGKR